MGRRSPAHRFTIKIAAAVLLAVIADQLFFMRGGGATVGLFVLAWCGGLLTSVPALRRGVPLAAVGGAALLGLVMVDDPSFLAWVMALCCLAVAVMLVRQRFTHAGEWAIRLAAFGLTGIIAVPRDLLKLSRVPGGSQRGGAAVRLLALPVIGGVLFTLLFAAANPLIGDLFARIEWPGFWRAFGHLLFAGTAIGLVWPTFRPYVLRLPDSSDAGIAIPTLPVATLTLSLAVFNLIFAVQNGLDLAFLWSGAALPAGVTLADYAHRGAYTLIATALLAGGFVLLVFRPGETMRSGALRRLVVLWIAQNVLLVASSILRLVDYIDAYSLTVLRIAALAWMALVGVGLMLICWRLLAGRSAAWLVNANALAALVVLAAASVVDLEAVAAAWNVRHARDARQLDLCYLSELGASSLLPLIELERRAGGPILRERVQSLRTRAQADLAERQADWHGWTWRGARRLARAEALAATLPPVRVRPGQRECDGSLTPPPRIITPPVVAAPLTNGAAR